VRSAAAGTGTDPCRAEQDGLSRERLARIRPLLETYVNENRPAGGNAVIAHHGKLVYFESFGFMDMESRHPMTKDAIFRVYSMSKPIIAVAALTL
jgi:CubicO group peptidase (beta-lactamase class C family)